MTEARPEQAGHPGRPEDGSSQPPNGTIRTVGAMLMVLVIAGLLGLVIVRASRGPTEPRAQRSALIAPVGVVAPGASIELVWHALPDAELYYVYVAGARGDTVFAVHTQDTTALVPRSVAIELRQPYRWWLVAVMPDGAHHRQPAREFVVGQP
ncbi:MAG: hypothetical protein ACRELX_06670 [Longimicrobiales bacterium]